MNLKSIAIALALFTAGLYTPAPALAIQTTAPAAPAKSNNDQKIKQLIDQYDKALDAKDWGTCLQIAEECKNLGESGFKLSQQMKFHVFTRSGDVGHAQLFLDETLQEVMSHTEYYFGVHQKNPKGLGMIDYALQNLDGMILQLKLMKLKALMATDKPTEYLDYAKSLMTGSDQNNAYVLNYMAWYIVCPDKKEEEAANLYRMAPDGQPMQVGTMGSNAPFQPWGIYIPMMHPASFQTKAMYEFARTASEKAIKISGAMEGDLTQKKNGWLLGNYLDTLGWVYHRLGLKEKAYQAEMRAASAPDHADFKQVAEWFKK